MDTISECRLIANLQMEYLHLLIQQADDVQAFANDLNTAFAGGKTQDSFRYLVGGLMSIGSVALMLWPSPGARENGTISKQFATLRSKVLLYRLSILESDWNPKNKEFEAWLSSWHTEAPPEPAFDDEKHGIRLLASKSFRNDLAHFDERFDTWIVGEYLRTRISRTEEHGNGNHAGAMFAGDSTLAKAGFRHPKALSLVGKNLASSALNLCGKLIPLNALFNAVSLIRNRARDARDDQRRRDEVKYQLNKGQTAFLEQVTGR